MVVVSGRYQRPEAAFAELEVVGKSILTALERAFKLRTFTQAAVTTSLG
jgi:hypothetical protein